jgi:hypothetical protein
MLPIQTNRAGSGLGKFVQIANCINALSPACVQVTAAYPAHFPFPMNHLQPFHSIPSHVIPSHTTSLMAFWHSPPTMKHQTNGRLRLAHPSERENESESYDATFKLRKLWTGFPLVITSRISRWSMGWILDSVLWKGTRIRIRIRIRI